MRKKQLTGGAVLSSFSQVISIVVGLVYVPIMIRVLGQNEYGLYQLVLSVVNYLNLMNFGFNGAYIRYYSIAQKKGDENEVANINGMFMKVFIVISILCFFVGTLLYFNIGILGKNISKEDYLIAKRLLVIMVINLSLSFPNSLFVAYISAREEFIFQKSLNVLINILVPILNLPLLYLGYGSIGVVVVTLFLTIIRFVINILYCSLKLHMKVHIKYFDNNIFKSLLGYTFFIFLSDLVDQLNSNVDKFLLGRIMGTIAVAIYSVGFTLRAHFTAITWIIPEMFIPEVNRVAVIENDDKKLTSLFTKTGRINNYIVLLIISGFVLFGREFIHLWVGPEYDLSFYATLILLITGYVPAVQTLGVNIQNAKNMHKTRSLVYLVVSCINIGLSIILISKWGVIGTCIGTLIATLAGHGIFMNLYYKKYIRLDIGFFWKELSKWYPFVLTQLALFFLFMRNIHINGWIELLVMVFVYSLIYGILLLLFGLKKEERQRVISLVFRRHSDED